MIKQEKVVELTKKLVSIKSPYFKEEKIMEFVKNWFQMNGLDARIHHYHEQKVTGFKGKNVILELKGQAPGPSICINGHLDTVNLCTGWTVDPYAGLVDGDRIYGLGALDMKSGCAATMLALKAFKENHPRFKGRIVAVYVSVEEGPYGMGTNALIEDGYLNDIDCSIVTEPSAGFAGLAFPTICLGARGGYGLEVEFYGKSAHAALPQEGISAVVDAAKVVLELENVSYITDEHLGKGAACVVALESDGGACSVPDFAKIKLFWHIVVGENENTIVEEVEKAIARAGIRSRYKISFRDAPSTDSKGFMPYIIKEDDPFVSSFINVVNGVCDTEPARAYFQSIGDFNYLGTRLGAPVILFGAAGENFHSNDEYATISSIVQTSEVVYEFLKKELT